MQSNRIIAAYAGSTPNNVSAPQSFGIIPAYAGSTLSEQLNLEVHLRISMSSHKFRSRQEPLTAWG